MPELDAGEFDHVDLDPFGGQIVEQRFQHQLRLVMQEESRVEQVYADNPQGFLLQAIFVVQHADMNDDLAVLIARMRLKFHAHPAVAFVGALKIARRTVSAKAKKAVLSPRDCRSRSRLRPCS